MVEAIKKQGGTKIKFTMYKGVKHDSYERAWREPALIDWLFKQKNETVADSADDLSALRVSFLGLGTRVVRK